MKYYNSNGDSSHRRVVPMLKKKTTVLHAHCVRMLMMNLPELHEQQLKEAHAEIEDLKAQICVMNLLKFGCKRFAVDDVSIEYLNSVQAFQCKLSAFRIIF